MELFRLQIMPAETLNTSPSVVSVNPKLRSLFLCKNSWSGLVLPPLPGIYYAVP